MAPIITYANETTLKGGVSENPEKFMKFREVISSDRRIQDFIKKRKSKYLVMH
jgi:hypothetical protein